MYPIWSPCLDIGFDTGSRNDQSARVQSVVRSISGRSFFDRMSKRLTGGPTIAALSRFGVRNEVFDPHMTTVA